MTIDDPDVKDLQTRYAETPRLPAVSLEDVTRGARRRQRRRRLAIATGISVGVTAIVTPFALSGQADQDSLPLQPSSTSGQISGPSTGPDGTATDSDAREMERLTDALYRILDADADLPYYMLQTDATKDTVTIWGSFNPHTTAALRAEARDVGARLELRRLPPLRDPGRLQSTVEVATAKMERLAADPAYGFAGLRVQYPLKNIVFWRVHPHPDTDRELHQIARDAGMELDLRIAPLSRTEGHRISARLMDENSRWQKYGFRVEGAAIQPSGLVVMVTGDAEAAERELLGTRHVIAIMPDAAEVLQPG